MTLNHAQNMHCPGAPSSARAGAILSVLLVGLLCACGGGDGNLRVEKDTNTYPAVTVTPALYTDVPLAGVPLQFTGGDCAGGNGHLTSQWTFGDGAVVNNPSDKSHTYASTGYYQFRVVCRDSQDGSAAKYSTYATSAAYIQVFAP